MKRQREAPQWQAPYELRIALLYYENGNTVLAWHSYEKWLSTLSNEQWRLINTYTELRHLTSELQMHADFTLRGFENSAITLRRPIALAELRHLTEFDYINGPNPEQTPLKIRLVQEHVRVGNWDYAWEDYQEYYNQTVPRRGGMERIVLENVRQRLQRLKDNPSHDAGGLYETLNDTAFSELGRHNQ